MELNTRKFVLYVLSVAVLSGIGLFVYDMFGLKKFHTSEVKVFCNTQFENVGVTNTRSLDMLKLYVGDKAKFDAAEPFKLENFQKDTIHVPRCIAGTLFSKRYNGARGVRLVLDGDERVVTVLTENITFLDEEE